jgi:hypothetical protein
MESIAVDHLSNNVVVRPPDLAIPLDRGSSILPTP